MARLYKEKALHHVVVEIPGVKDEVHDEAESGARKAKARLARHRYQGQAKVTVTQGDVDSFINLEDPNALSIEFGHFVKGKFGNKDGTPKHVKGLYIITGGAGLLD
ncbi:tail completion or Neck1 protein [Mycobacterium phage MyraDee]|uniref:Head-to-tail connector protein n=1 Tax=Mycobacterium phage MyraDee TaxID=2024303 RepID=A0A222Z048_9CAUD|nr:tail completion or Neck1 protein [Mycobacterium phage MyraDee]ASR77126.1 head-to-tail connector protein [Mycobacterium phage MyraDee]